MRARVVVVVVVRLFCVVLLQHVPVISQLKYHCC